MLYVKPFPDIRVVVPQLRPAFSTIVQAIEAGIERSIAFVKSQPATAAGFDSEFRGQLVTACIVAAGKELLSVHPTPPGTRDVFVHDGVIYALKKAKRRRVNVASNHKSDRQDAIRRVENKRNTEATFPFSEGEFVHVVYRLDSTLEHLESVAVACPKGYKVNKWAYPFLDEVRGVGGALPFGHEVAAETVVEAAVKISKKESS